MTLAEYRLFTEKERTELVMLLMNSKENFIEPSNPPHTQIASIDYYYQLRFQNRSKQPNINWPKELSKKERIGCKLQMMKIMTELLNPITNDAASIQSTFLAFIQDLQTNYVFAKPVINKQGYPEKYQGLPEDAVRILNYFYKFILQKVYKDFVIYN